ncbi:class I SAM-dependent methyltransferase [Bacteroidota bacterium]
MVKILQIIAYCLLQIAFLPVIFPAVIILNYKAYFISKKFGVDYTAVKVLQLRCKMHLLGVRKDKDSIALYKSLPIASFNSLRIIVAPAIIANKITGFSSASMNIPDKENASIFQYIYVRTLEFDRILEKNINDVGAFVVMGAGYDLRVLKYVKDKRIKVYELDQAPIQQLKKQCLKKADLLQDSISYIAVDFNNESWSDKLLKNGFDSIKKTFFLWEGVASYLNEDIVVKTLQTLKLISAQESIISFDFNSTLYNEAKGSFMERTIVRLMRMTGKVFLFGIDTSDAKKNAELFLSKSDLKLKDLTLIGKDTKTVHPFSGIIEATTINRKSAHNVYRT